MRPLLSFSTILLLGLCSARAAKTTLLFYIAPAPTQLSNAWQDVETDSVSNAQTNAPAPRGGFSVSLPFPQLPDARVRVDRAIVSAPSKPLRTTAKQSIPRRVALPAKAAPSYLGGRL